MNKAKIMILGTFHFKTEESTSIIKIQDDKRQNELKEIIKKISKFNPNKLCVELRPSEEGQYNKLFQEFLYKSNLDLSKRLAEIGIRGADYSINDAVDERIKFAFDIAKYNKLNYIYGIDYYDGWTQPLVFKKAKENHALYKNLNESFMKFANKYYGLFTEETTIEDIYKSFNSKEFNEFQHVTSFLPFNDIEIGDDSIGIDFVASWYKRNLHIFSNLKHICNDDDRVLVLYGAGHLKLLRDFINDSLDLEYTEVLPYLI
ncbi:DUF5694 domain-containing protein [uncultured Clostridium sp.]|uniref:DUF5694 domain-containing protein n=1 Tax=uncultured Clostridium sp. TaxID=59620 RepID=UPI0032163A91